MFLDFGLARLILVACWLQYFLAESVNVKTVNPFKPSSAKVVQNSKDIPVAFFTHFKRHPWGQEGVYSFQTTVVPNSISKRIGFSVEYFADDDTWQDIGRMAVIAGTEEVIDVGSIHGMTESDRHYGKWKLVFHPISPDTLSSDTEEIRFAMIAIAPRNSIAYEKEMVLKVKKDYDQFESTIYTKPWGNHLDRLLYPS